MWKNIKVIRKDSLGMLEQQINFKNLRFFFFFLLHFHSTCPLLCWYLSLISDLHCIIMFSKPRLGQYLLLPDW